MLLNIVSLSEQAKEKYINSPKFKFRELDSAIDLMNAGETVEIQPGETKLIGAGIACQITEDNSSVVPDLVEIQVRPRSGLSSKGIHVNFGTVDASYTGEILVSVYNASNEIFKVEPWDRIAQLVVTPILKPTITFVEDFPTTTDRGAKGIGSSGVK